MKIYNKGSFLAGVLCAFALLLFLLDLVRAEWWQWIIAAAFSVKFLYGGLSKTASARSQFHAQHYQQAARALFGRYRWVKTNLPYLGMGFFFAAAILARFAFQVILPIWLWVLFLMFLTVAVAYSIGVNRKITEYLDTLAEEQEDGRP